MRRPSGSRISGKTKMMVVQGLDGTEESCHTFQDAKIARRAHLEITRRAVHRLHGTACC